MTPQATKLIEECSEVIHALCKIERFGPDGTHPDSGETNEKRLFSEIEDLDKAVRAYLESLGFEGTE